MIRVAVIIGKMDSGGKKNLVMEYYRHINRNRVQFDFICDADSQAIPTGEIQNMGGRVYKITPYQHILGNMRDMYRIFRQNKYPVVHAYNSTMNIFSMLIGALAGVPVRISESLSTAHKSESKTLIKKILRLFSKCFATHYMACGVTCANWQFGSRLCREGKVAIFKTAVNSDVNRYNPELREKTRKEYHLDGHLVIGFIGRFVQQKNPLFMIEVFSEICKLDDTALLLLIGDGKLKNDMAKRVENLGIQKHVLYLGRREDIQQFYNAMDAFLLPSLYEGLPVVGLESQSCGLPIFFSTEVTRQASACEIGHFIKLETSASEWAKEIVTAVRANMPIRRSRAEEIRAAGFDSRTESQRLEDYYFKALEKSVGSEGYAL